ncbi:MAG TPA: hypothetical protein VND19_15595 [Acetobacteraceae bacterium]|nr:hypothetical protein [Acetobacteraceae bacterium]
MAYYRLYLLNDTERIFDCQAIERDSDDAAVLAAAVPGVHSPAVEIWAGARKVAHLTAEQLDSQRASLALLGLFRRAGRTVPQRVGSTSRDANDA